MSPPTYNFIFDGKTPLTDVAFTSATLVIGAVGTIVAPKLFSTTTYPPQMSAEADPVISDVAAMIHKNNFLIRFSP
jgi:hypothetical protein